MKKLIATIIVIMIMVTMFAGCSTNNGTTNTTTTTEPNTPAPTESVATSEDYKKLIQPTLVHIYSEDLPYIRGWRVYYYDTANNNVVIYMDVNSLASAGIGASGVLTDSITGKPIHLDEFLARRGIDIVE